MDGEKEKKERTNGWEERKGRSEEERKRKENERVNEKKEKEGTLPCFFVFCLME